jgi:hypothetical protein
MESLTQEGISGRKDKKGINGVRESANLTARSLSKKNISCNGFTDVTTRKFSLRFAD